MRLEEKYTKEIKDAMMSKFNYKSVMPVSYTHLTLPTKLEV